MHLAATTNAKKLAMAGKSSQCKGCNKGYKDLSRLWGKDSSWKTWWLGSTDREQVEWYREKRQIADQAEDETEAKKRKVTVTSKSEKSTTNKMDVEVHWKPYRIMKKDIIQEGITEKQDESLMRMDMIPFRFVSGCLSGDGHDPPISNSSDQKRGE